MSCADYHIEFFHYSIYFITIALKPFVSAGTVLRGYSAVKNAVNQIKDELEDPSLLIATNMRKSMACVTQVKRLYLHNFILSFT